MNKVFQFSRFVKLVKWQLATDRPYNRKNLLVWIGSFCFISIFLFVIKQPDDARLGALAFFSAIATCVVVGGSYMFLSFRDRKDGIRELLLVPASNVEKFLSRYLVSFIVTLLSLIVAVIAADGLQYALNVVAGHDDVSSVIAIIIRLCGRTMQNAGPLLCHLLLLAIWAHTFFLFGANLFRSVKYSWVFTTLIIVAIIALLVCVWSFGSSDAYENGYSFGQMVHNFLLNNAAVMYVVLPLLSVFNVVLSYLLFCRRQLIGRFTNI